MEDSLQRNLGDRLTAHEEWVQGFSHPHWWINMCTRSMDGEEYMRASGRHIMKIARQRRTTFKYLSHSTTTFRWRCRSTKGDNLRMPRRRKSSSLVESELEEPEDGAPREESSSKRSEMRRCSRRGSHRRKFVPLPCDTWTSATHNQKSTK